MCIRPVPAQRQLLHAWQLAPRTPRCTAASLPCSLVDDAGQYNEAQLAGGAVQLQTTIKHKYGDDLTVHIKVEMGGEPAPPRQQQAHPAALGRCCGWWGWSHVTAAVAAHGE